MGPEGRESSTGEGHARMPRSTECPVVGRRHGRRGAPAFYRREARSFLAPAMATTGVRELLRRRAGE